MTLTREQWLAERKNHIGASEVAAILGVDPRRGPLSVYEQKTTGHSIDDNEWMTYGRDIEAAIANMYQNKIGRKVTDLGATSFQFHPDYPWIGATLDRMVEFEDGTHGPLELKSVDPLGARITPAQWQEEPPLHYIIQLQIQMACTNSQLGVLAALFPGYQLACYEAERDDELLELAYPVLSQFWERVINKDPPDADSLPGTNAVLKRLYIEESGETVMLDRSHLLIADALERARAERSKLDKEITLFDSNLRSSLKSASFGVLPDGTLLSLKTTKRDGFTVEPTEYRVLRRTRPKGK